jgi:lysophospholipid acyltransferase (LPLAT)-like uncharacterized protein
MTENRPPASAGKSDSTSDPRMADDTHHSRSAYSRWDRFKFWTVSYLGYFVIRLIGSTLRWQVEGWEHWQSIKDKGENLIYAFWHGRIFMGTFFFRKRGIVVMTSQNRDGEYIAGVISRFGYSPARGSSTRGGRGALVEMIRALRKAKDVAFTVDGPKGPRYVAKPGAVWIASKSGAPVLPFNISVERKWVLNSWDRFHIPWPFSRTYLLIGSPIYVERSGSEEAMELAQRSLQAELEGLLARADARYESDE